MKYEEKISLVPLWKRLTLSVLEASFYSGISRKKLAKLTDEPNCDFVMWVGEKKMIKRDKLDDFIDEAYML